MKTGQVFVSHTSDMARFPAARSFVQGRFSEARDLDTYVLDRQQAVLGPEHLHTLMTAGSLGADLRALGDFERALASDRETYGIFKDRFGDDYPRTLAAAFNLATALCHAGDFPAARRLNQGHWIAGNVCSALGTW